MSEDGYSDIFFERLTYALVIGISKYQNGYESHEEASAEKFSNLRFAADDAERFKKFLENRGIKGANVICLKDEDAKLARIHDAFDQLTNWCATPGVEDPLVIVFFSGHGWVDDRDWKYFLPYDADKKALYRTGFNNRDFNAWLDRLQTSSLVILLDACHAGYFGSVAPEPGEKGGDLKEANRPEYDYSELGQGKGRVILASCHPKKKSYEVSLPASSSGRPFNNGVFTGCLLDLLEYGTDEWGEEECITTLNLFDRLKAKMKLYHETQEPFITNMGESITLAINQRARKRREQAESMATMLGFFNSLVEHCNECKPGWRCDEKEEVWMRLAISGFAKNRPDPNYRAFCQSVLVVASDWNAEDKEYLATWGRELIDAFREAREQAQKQKTATGRAGTPAAARLPSAPKVAAPSGNGDRVESSAASPGSSTAQRTFKPSAGEQLRQSREGAHLNVVDVMADARDNAPA